MLQRKIVFGDAETDYQPENMLAGDGVNTGRAWPAGLGEVSNAVQDTLRHDYDMATLPELCERVLTHPSTSVTQRLTPSISSGKLRLTAAAANTDNNLREVLGFPGAHAWGDGEIKASWAGNGVSAATWDATSRYQFGNAHRIRSEERIQDDGTATGGTSTTLVDTGKAWDTNQWVGASNGHRQAWVRIVDGTGAGQKRRVRSHTDTTITVADAWDTDPEDDSIYEVYSVNVRALSVINTIAFLPHSWFQFMAWENGSFHQFDALDLSTYLRPAGVLQALPWYVKTRVYRGNLDIAVWRGSDTEPEYGDAGVTGSAPLPEGWADEPGQLGVYAGHLDATEYLEYDAVTITGG